MPRTLRSILAAGSMVAALQLSPALAGEPPPATRLRVNLTPAGSEGVPVIGQLHLHRVGGEDLDAARGERRVILQGEPSIAIDLPPATWWQVELVADGWWSPSRVVASTDQQLRLPIYPTGELRLELGVQRSATPPAALSVAFGRSASDRVLRRGNADLGGGEGPEGELACAPEGETWSCAVPAGRSDLRFHAPGFASAFRWGVEVGPGAVSDLGRLPLAAGGSVLGWIEAPPEGGLDPDGIAARLAPSGLDPIDPRAATMSRDARPGPRGVFQFVDLPPGSYRLTIQAPGWAVAVREDVRVLADRETRLDEPIELVRPSSLEVCLEPPAVPKSFGEKMPWRVTLYPDSRERNRPLLGKTGDDGCWQARDVRPGPYSLVVEDRLGSRWHSEDLVVESGRNRRQLTIPAVAIAGTVSQGGTPTRARLAFRRTVGPTAARAAWEQMVVLYTDLEAELAGSLPAEGRWQVAAMTAKSSGAEQSLGAVDVVQPAEGPARLDFEIPTTLVEGRVVDSEGKPVAHANVDASPVEKSEDHTRSQAASDEDGRFVFDGLAPGRYRMTAMTQQTTGDRSVEVEELPQVAHPEIVLVATRKLSGQVVGENGPVIGAQVAVYADLLHPRQRPVSKLTTDVRGEFVLDVPVDAVGLRLAVLPPGYAARILRVDPRTEARLLVAVDSLGGDLDLSGPDLAGGDLLIVDGTMVWLEMLRDWAKRGGSALPGEWRLPAMAIGNYRLCRSSGSPCDEGFLAPLETLTLSLDADKPFSRAASPPRDSDDKDLFE